MGPKPKEFDKISSGTYDIFRSDDYKNIPMTGKVAQCKVPSVLAHSTAETSGRDDGPNGKRFPEYAEAYARAYGVNLNSSRPVMGILRFRAADRRELGPPSFMDPQIATASKAFIDANRERIDEVVNVLASRHPNLHRENIFLFLCKFVFTEFALFNETDLIQDAAASVYAGVDEPLRATMKRQFPDTFKISAGFTWLGSQTWQFESRRRNVPIESQGLGPLQIIPGLALAAKRYPKIIEAYGKFLSATDFADTQSVIRASFDINKLFALKAVTLDVELQAIEDAKVISCLPQREDNHLDTNMDGELALLETAFKLVQFPEEAKKALSYAGAFSREESLFGIFTLGTILGVRPWIEGVDVRESAPLDRLHTSTWGVFDFIGGRSFQLSYSDQRPLEPILTDSRLGLGDHSVLRHLTREKTYPPNTSSNRRQIAFEGRMEDINIFVEVFMPHKKKPGGITINIYLSTTPFDFNKNMEPTYQVTIASSEDPIATIRSALENSFIERGKTGYRVVYQARR